MGERDNWPLCVEKDDMARLLDKNFRTIPEPFARAIAGVSMGGFGAMFLGLIGPPILFFCPGRASPNAP
jgi:S-formylglutathione hydrolase FrmB